ncbi:hypothetical protein Pmani_012189 [Petrolisthes manimaculis]|uniref:Uncharacterized protein n=1 Tax=Petrolisthes manimaculis TaxID=1843537 RepID=A0AAE1PXM5_9EUCA|nr:hypothetical protein Pmani_012189 [Petrolisthes manimaculis]
MTREQISQPAPRQKIIGGRCRRRKRRSKRGHIGAPTSSFGRSTRSAPTARVARSKVQLLSWPPVSKLALFYPPVATKPDLPFPLTHLVAIESSQSLQCPLPWPHQESNPLCGHITQPVPPVPWSQFS